MPRKQQPVWVCNDCGEEQVSWSGKCPNCGAWNTLKEVRLPTVVAGRMGQPRAQEALEVVSLDVSNAQLALPDRLATGMHEVDRVLGGGFFPGTVALVAGEPGIGKSTLLLELARALSRAVPVVYASGEESASQIQHRAQRLGILPAPVQLVATTELSGLLRVLETLKPGFVIIDSIQTLVDTRYPSAAGSVVQVRECALALQQWAKQTGTTLVIVGHVTKEGVVAGPRTLEHLVDVVLTLEGERLSDLRLLRTVKNRFGPTEEVGILTMTEAGLMPVDNPSARFLEERVAHAAGSAVTVILEGTRPLLVEIQALTRSSASPYPRRTASGFDLGRMELLIAVLEARAGLRLNNLDCYVNVSGGLRLREPAADLAVALALASAATQTVIDPSLAIYGEVGLAGEIRRVTQAARRREEAKRLGFPRVLEAKHIRDALKEMSGRPLG